MTTPSRSPPPSWRSTPLTTPAPHRGLPPTPISNPGLASIARRGAPRARLLPVLRRRRRRLRRAGLLHRRRPIRTRRRRLPRSAARERRARPDLPEEVGGGAVPRLGVLGWPVAHSRSPAMHNAALRALGMDGWRYQLLPVPPERFDETVARARGRGVRRARTSRSPTSTRRSRSPTSPVRPRARSVRRTRSRSPPTARSPPRTPTPPAFSPRSASRRVA